MRTYVPYPNQNIVCRPQYQQIINRSPGRNFDAAYDRHSGSRSPLVDIKEETGVYTLKADLPGIKEDGVRLETKEGYMTLTATAPKNEETDRYLLKERRSTQFNRRFNLPKDADGQNAKATLKNGVLSVSIPKLPSMQPRSIEVKQG